MPDKLSRLVSNPEETEASIDTETAVLAVAVAQVAISDAEYAIISSQHNAIRGHSGVDVTLNRLRNGGYTFPNLELKVRTFIRKCPLCQLTSQIKPLVVSLPSHMCGPYWPTSKRRGRIPVHTGSDMCVLTLNRTFSNEDHNCRGNCTLYSSALWSMGNCRSTSNRQ